MFIRQEPVIAHVTTEKGLFSFLVSTFHAIYDFSTKLCKIRSKLTFLLRHTLCVHGVIKLLDSLAFIASVEALLKVTSTSQDYGHHC